MHHAIVTKNEPYFEPFALRLRVALRGVAWRAIVSDSQRHEALTIARHATQRAAVMTFWQAVMMMIMMKMTINVHVCFCSLCGR